MLFCCSSQLFLVVCCGGSSLFSKNLPKYSFFDLCTYDKMEKLVHKCMVFHIVILFHVTRTLLKYVCNTKMDDKSLMNSLALLFPVMFSVFHGFNFHHPRIRQQAADNSNFSRFDHFIWLLNISDMHRIHNHRDRHAGPPSLHVHSPPPTQIKLSVMVASNGV